MSGQFVINDIDMINQPVDIITSQKRYSNRVNIFRGKAQTVMGTNMGTNRQTVVLVFNTEDRMDMGNFVKLMSRLVNYPFAFINQHQLFRQQIAEGDALAGHPYKPVGDNFHIYGVESIKLSQEAQAQGMIILELSLIFFNYIPFAHGLQFIATKNFSRLSTSIRNAVNQNQLKKTTEYFDVESPQSSDIYTKFFNDDWAVINQNIGGIDNNDSFFVKAPFMDTPKPQDGVDYKEIKVMKDFADDSMQDISELFETKFVSWVNVKTLTGDPNFNNAVTPMQSITVEKKFRFAEINLAAWHKPVLQYLGEGDVTVDVQFECNNEYTNGLGEFDPMHNFHFLQNKVEDNYARHPKLQLFNHLKVDCFFTNAIDHFDFIIDRQLHVHSGSEQGKSSIRMVMLGVSPEYFANIGKYYQAGTKLQFFNEIGGDELLVGFYERMQSLRRISNWRKYSAGNKEMASAVRTADEDINLGDSEEIFRRLAELCESNGINSNDPNAINELIYIARKRSSTDQRLLLRLQDAYMKLLRMPSTAQPDFNKMLIAHRKKVWDGQSVIIGKFRGEAWSEFTLGRKAGIQPVDIQSIKKIGNLSPFMFLRKSSYLTEPMLTAQYSEFLDWEQSQAVRVLQKVASQWAERSNSDIDDIIQTAVELKDSGFEYDFQKRAATTAPEREGPFDFQSLLGQTKLRGMEGVVPEDRAMAYNEDLAAVLQLEGMVGPFQDSLKQVFPVIKVYLVRQFDSDYAFTDIPVPQFFELKGIGDIQVVTPQDENPVGVATIQMSNPGNIYTHTMDIFTQAQPKLNPELRNTEDSFDIKLDQIQLQVGHMLHIRAGYSNDVNKLETIFNGQITSIEGTEVLEVLAETYGRELIAVEHGDDPDEDNFWFHSDTESVIGEALAMDEIENFGETVWDFNPFNGFNEKDAKAQRLQFLRSRIYMNVFASAIEEVDDVFQGFWNQLESFFIPNRTAFYQFSMYKITPWEMLKEMQCRHPNTLSKVLMYGHRATYFFGVKEQLYLAKDLAKENMDESFYEAPFFDIFEDQYEAQKYQNQMESLRYKPVSQVHIAMSETNIVFNNLRVTDEFNTAVRVAFYEDQDDIKDNSYEYLTMHLDDNLRASQIRLGEMFGGGIHKQFMAYRYGTEYLRSEVEKMYDGTIRLIGNQRIKAGDYIYVHDQIRGLTGMVKVRECVHHFTSDAGFVTDITPGLFAEANEVTYSTLFHRLMATAIAACISLQPKIIDKYSTAAEYNLMDLTSKLSDIYGEQIKKVEFQLFSGEGAYSALNAGLYAGASYTGLSSLYRMMGYSAQGNIITNAIVQGKTSIQALKAYAAKANITKFSGVGSASKAVWSATRTMAVATGQLARLDAAAAARTLLTGIKLKPVLSTAIRGTTLAFGAGGAIAGSLTAPGAVAFLALYGISTIAIEALTSTIFFGLKIRQPVRIYPIKINGISYTGGIVGYKDNDLLESFMDEAKKTWKDLGKVVTYFTADSQVELQ